LSALFDTQASALATDGLLGASVGAYLAGVAVVAQRGRRWPRRWTALFVAGLATVFVAVGSRIGASDDVNVPDHVVQHLLLMMVAPPLLVAGRIPVLLSQLAPRSLQRRVVRVFHHPMLRRPPGPLLWVVYFGSMWACFVPAVYRLEVTKTAVHDAVHVGLVGAGLLFWQGVLAFGTSWRSVGYLRRVAPLLAGMPAEAGLGFFLVSLGAPLARSTLVDTHRGGQVFWMAAMTLSGVGVVMALWQWVSAEERSQLHSERVVRQPVATGSVLEQV
jgi:putative copper resistance protein D